MAETTKRDRSSSPSAERVEASKRPKEETTTTETKKMADTEKPAAATADATEEQNAVELDSGANAADDHVDGANPSTSNGGAAGATGSAGADGDAGGDSTQAMSGVESTSTPNPTAAGAAGADSELQPQNISMKALIVTGDASVIIGKQGKHINEIRDKSGARLTIVGFLSS